MRSTAGHVIIGTGPGGDGFVVIVTEDSDALNLIKASFGPYRAE